jgi:TolB protein
VVNADGSGQRRLTWSAAPDLFPVWSPDGQKIAFLSWRDRQDGASDLYVMNADGSGQQDLTHTPSVSDGWGLKWAPTHGG